MTSQLEHDQKVIRELSLANFIVTVALLVSIMSVGKQLSYQEGLIMCAASLMFIGMSCINVCRRARIYVPGQSWWIVYSPWPSWLLAGIGFIILMRFGIGILGVA